MSRSKKRKLTQLNRDVRAQTSPLSKYSHELTLKPGSQSNLTPRNRREFFTESPFWAGNKTAYVQSNTPSLRSKKYDRQSSFTSYYGHSHGHGHGHVHEHGQYPTTVERRAVLSPSYGNFNTTIPMHSSNINGRNHSVKDVNTPTMIIPPADPRPSYLSAVRAQNRSKTNHSPTFTALAPTLDESQSSPNLKGEYSKQKLLSPERVSDHSDDHSSDTETNSSDESVETVDRNASKSRHEQDSDEKLSTTSDSGDSSSDSDDDDSSKRTHRSDTQSASMGIEFIAEMEQERKHKARKEKAKMERATKRAIKSLRTAVAPSKKKKAKRQSKSFTTTTLSTQEVTLLASLHDLVPVHILAHTRNNLQSQAQAAPHPPEQTQRPDPGVKTTSATNSTANNHDNAKANHVQAISTLSLTLASAETLIVLLSYQRLCNNLHTATSNATASGSSNTDIGELFGAILGPMAGTGGGDLSLQNELVRIVKEREERVELLEAEVKRLKGEVEQAQKREREGENTV